MNPFTGTGRLLRLALRRDRIKLPISIAAVVGIFVASVAGVASIYVTDADKISYATMSASSAATSLFNGAIMGTSTAAIVVNETFVFTSIFVALISTFLVVRHTRQNEETGRSEMIESGAVGRLAQLGAALSLSVAVNILLGITVGLSYYLYDLPLDGSILAGLCIALVGIVFSGIAALAAQISSTARGANSLAAAAVAVSFLVRGIGDMFGKVEAGGTALTTSWPSWISPLGIARNSNPYYDNNWWVAAVLLGIYVMAIGLSYYLVSKRDMGAGLLPKKKGRPAAKRSLLGTVGLAWRLQRGVLIGWAIALAVFAGTFGAVITEVEGFDSEQMSEVMAALGGSENMIEAFLSFTLMLFGVMIAAYAIQALLRMRSEESRGHLEVLLSTSVDRRRWLLSHLTIVTLGSAFLLALSGAVSGLAYGLTDGNLVDNVISLTSAAMVYLPAVMLFCGTTVLAFGFFPNFSIAIAWMIFIATYLINQLSALLKLSDWTLNLSPFSHLPLVPSEDMNWTPVIILSIIAVTALLVGTAAFHRRNLSTAA